MPHQSLWSSHRSVSWDFFGPISYIIKYFVYLDQSFGETNGMVHVYVTYYRTSNNCGWVAFWPFKCNTVVYVFFTSSVHMSVFVLLISWNHYVSVLFMSWCICSVKSQLCFPFSGRSFGQLFHLCQLKHTRRGTSQNFHCFLIPKMAIRILNGESSCASYRIIKR